MTCCEKEQAANTSEPTCQADQAPDVKFEKQSPTRKKPSIFRQDAKKTVPHKSINWDRLLLREELIDRSHNVTKKQVCA